MGIIHTQNNQLRTLYKYIVLSTFYHLKMNYGTLEQDWQPPPLIPIG